MTNNPWGIGAKQPPFIDLATFKGEIQWAPASLAKAESQKMKAATAASPRKKYSEAIEPAGGGMRRQKMLKASI